MANVPMLEYPSPSSSSPSNSFASESQCSGVMEEEEEGPGEGKEERCKAVDGQEGVFMTQVCTDTVSALASYQLLTVQTLAWGEICFCCLFYLSRKQLYHVASFRTHLKIDWRLYCPLINVPPPPTPLNLLRVQGRKYRRTLLPGKEEEERHPAPLMRRRSAGQ